MSARRTPSVRVWGWAGLALMLAYGVGYLAWPLARTLNQRARLRTATHELAELRAGLPTSPEERLREIKDALDHRREWLTRSVPPVSTGLVAQPTERSFKLFLVRALSELQAHADTAGVQVRPGYTFGFETEARQVGYPPACLPALWRQVEDIQAVCSALFGAGIARLESVRRVTPTSFGPPRSADILGDTGQVQVCAIPGALGSPPREGAWAVEIWPYEFTFLARGPALTRALEALAERAPRWAVTDLSVTKGNGERPKFLRPPAQGPVVKRPVPTPHPPKPLPPSGDRREEEEVWRTRLRLEVLHPGRLSAPSVGVVPQASMPKGCSVGVGRLSRPGAKAGAAPKPPHKAARNLRPGRVWD